MSYTSGVRGLILLTYKPNKSGSKHRRDTDNPEERRFIVCETGKCKNYATEFDSRRPTTYPVGMGYILSGIERPRHEADQSSLSSAKLKNVWNYNSTIPYVFFAWYLMKSQVSRLLGSLKLIDMIGGQPRSKNSTV